MWFGTSAPTTDASILVRFDARFQTRFDFDVRYDELRVKLFPKPFLHVGAPFDVENGTTYVGYDDRVADFQLNSPKRAILQGKEYRGYYTSRRSYFYGVKVHIVVTASGIPVEYSFTVGSVLDLDGFRQMFLELPSESTLLADSAYTDYTLEKVLADKGLRLLAARKENSKRPHQPWVEFLIQNGRR